MYIQTERIHKVTFITASTVGVSAALTSKTTILEV